MVGLVPRDSEYSRLRELVSLGTVACSLLGSSAEVIGSVARCVLGFLCSFRGSLSSGGVCVTFSSSFGFVELPLRAGHTWLVGVV